MLATTCAPTSTPLTLTPVSTRPSGSTMPQRSLSMWAARTVPASTVLSPMKPATKRLVGISYMRVTASICWISPSLNTATRSDIVSASPWSCVT